MILFLLMQVTTTCVPLGGQVTCTSTQPPAYRAPPITQVDVGAAIRNMPRYEPRSVQDEPITSFQHELMSRMRVLIQQRRCEDSFTLAALAGEPELADSSRRVCPLRETGQ